MPDDESYVVPSTKTDADHYLFHQSEPLCFETKDERPIPSSVHLPSIVSFSRQSFNCLPSIQPSIYELAISFWCLLALSTKMYPLNVNPFTFKSWTLYELKKMQSTFFVNDNINLQYTHCYTGIKAISKLPKAKRKAIHMTGWWRLTKYSRPLPSRDPETLHYL